MSTLKIFEISADSNGPMYPLGMIALSPQEAIESFREDYPETVIDGITITFKGYVGGVSDPALDLFASIKEHRMKGCPVLE